MRLFGCWLLLKMPLTLLRSPFCEFPIQPYNHYKLSLLARLSWALQAALAAQTAELLAYLLQFLLLLGHQRVDSRLFVTGEVELLGLALLLGRHQSADVLLQGHLHREAARVRQTHRVNSITPVHYEEWLHVVLLAQAQVRRVLAEEEAAENAAHLRRQLRKPGRVEHQGAAVAEGEVPQRPGYPLAHLRVELLVEVELVADDDRRQQQRFDAPAVLVVRRPGCRGFDVLSLSLRLQLLQEAVGLIPHNAQPLTQRLYRLQGLAQVDHDCEEQPAVVVTAQQRLDDSLQILAGDFVDVHQLFLDRRPAGEGVLERPCRLYLRVAVSFQRLHERRLSCIASSHTAVVVAQHYDGLLEVALRSLLLLLLAAGAPQIEAGFALGRSVSHLRSLKFELATIPSQQPPSNNQTLQQLLCQAQTERELIILSSMHMRSAFLLLLTLTLVGSEVTNISRFVKPDYPVARSTTNYLLVVSNDGGIYKFDPAIREILWHRTLRTDLMSANLTEASTAGGYFLPDLNGDFVYVSRSQNIMEVQREDLQQLLDLCFQQDEKHLLFESSTYYVLDLSNGSLQALQDFLKGRQAIDRSNAVLRLNRKYLKSMRDEHRNWNIISSQMDFFTVTQFISQNTKPNQNKPHPFYTFERENSHTLQITDRASKLSYELESDASFIDIFSFDGASFVRHKLESTKGKGRESKPSKDLAIPSPVGIRLTGRQATERPTLEWDTSNKSDGKAEKLPSELSPLEFCINTFRVLKEAKEEVELKQLAESSIREFRERFSEPRTTRQLEISPLTLVLILLTGVGFIAVGVKVIQKKISSMSESLKQTNADLSRRLEHMQVQLTNFNEISKHANAIYSVDYSREAIETEEVRQLRQATFLGKRVHVHILWKPVDERAVETLSKIYNHQPSFVTKVLYLFESDKSWLVFVEPTFTTLGRRLAAETPMPRKTQKHLKEQIVKLVGQLTAENYPIDCLSPSHVVFDKDGHMKFNPLAASSELWMAPEEIKAIPSPAAPLNFMLGCLIYFIYTGGELLYRHGVDQHPDATKMNMAQLRRSKEAIQTLENDIALEDLLNKLIPDDKKSEQLPLREITEHFYFWDSIRKLSFIGEFSNYLETFVDDQKLRRFEEFCRDNAIIDYPWSQRLHRPVLLDFCSFRKYDYQSARELIRMIRNKTSHFMQVGQAVREIVGKTKEELCMYFLDRFPKLLCFMFVYSKKKKWKL